jgi:hypothetical protein
MTIDDKGILIEIKWLTLLIYNKLICLKNINNIMIYMIIKVNLKHIYIYIY